MANTSGIMYGLTIVSPIVDDEKMIPSHDLQLREYLANLSVREDGPFAVAPHTHLCRLFVLDDVVYPGMPAKQDHLKSKYLVFESNFDGELDEYFEGLARAVPAQIGSDMRDTAWGSRV